jgi:outer membrane biosynthesis protein TonB
MTKGQKEFFSMTKLKLNQIDEGVYLTTNRDLPPNTPEGTFTPNLLSPPIPGIRSRSFVLSVLANTAIIGLAMIPAAPYVATVHSDPLPTDFHVVSVDLRTVPPQKLPVQRKDEVKKPAVNTEKQKTALADSSLATPQIEVAFNPAPPTPSKPNDEIPSAPSPKQVVWNEKPVAQSPAPSPVGTGGNSFGSVKPPSSAHGPGGDAGGPEPVGLGTALGKGTAGPPKDEQVDSNSFEVLTAPVILNWPRPNYPNGRKLKGDVIVNVTFDKAGFIVFKSFVQRLEDEEFNSIAREAVQHITFRAAKLGDVAINFDAEVTVRFRLNQLMLTTSF